MTNKKIFIDGGAYKGTSVEQFRNKFKDHQEYEIHCFEANKQLAEHFDNLDVKLHQFVMSDSDGRVKFYNSGDQGSSIFKDKSEYYPTGFLDDTELPSVSVDRWIKENTSPEDYIVLKLNIEGAEYKVLQSMIEGGSIHRIDRLYVDWHCGKTEHVSQEEHIELVEKLLDIGKIPIDFHRNRIAISDKDVSRPRGKLESRKTLKPELTDRWQKIKIRCYQ